MKISRKHLLVFSLILCRLSFYNQYDSIVQLLAYFDLGLLDMHDYGHFCVDLNSCSTLSTVYYDSTAVYSNSIILKCRFHSSWLPYDEKHFIL